MITEPLRRQIHLLARVDPQVLVEDKPHSIAVHYRLALQQETFLMKEVATIVSREPPGDLEILFGKAVIEIKPTLFSKGSAVTELMTHPPFAGRVPLFIGDDMTDKSVFGILPEFGRRGIFRRRSGCRRARNLSNSRTCPGLADASLEP